jgi:flagellar biosynthesis protein FlhB
MADRTEAPTSHRQEEARTEGNVARSLELNTAAIILIGAILLNGPGKQIGAAFRDLLLSSLAEIPTAELTQRYLEQAGYNFAVQVGPSLFLFLLGLLLTGVIVTMGQTRFLWASKKIGFDFKRVNPISGFKRIFSSHGLVEVGKASLKLLLIGYVTYTYLNAHIPDVISLFQVDLVTSINQFVNLGIGLAMQVGEIYLILAIADYVYQRWSLMRSMRMTKEEIKEEVKRSEGDPYLKSRIRGQMRRMARQRMMSAVPKATVVVVNPTHLAVAIEYREGMAAPKVLAKGAHRTAERIVAIAREHFIPVVQNIPLARAIYKTIEIDHEISPDLYRAMAEVLAYVFRLRGLNHRPAPSRALN